MGEPEKKKARLIKALDSMIYMPKVKQLREDIGVPGLAFHEKQGILSIYDGVISPDPGRKRKDVPSIGRPWDRGELYARLQTFKSMTWFGKPARVNALECARRGWENSGMDELTCETCRAVMKYPIIDHDEEFEAAVAESFEAKLALGHESMCPWRSSVCSLSLLEFPRHLSCTTIEADFRSRSLALQKLLCIPPIAKEALDTMLPESGINDTFSIIKNGQHDQAYTYKKELAKSADLGIGVMRETKASLGNCISSYLQREAFMARVRLLALCGWTLRILAPENLNTDDDIGHCLPEHAALQCTLCGARVGLWSFFDGCTPKPFSAASLAEKSGVVYNSSKASFILNNQVAMNMTTTIAGGMLHQVDDMLLRDIDGPFGKAGTNSEQPFSSPGGSHATAKSDSSSFKEKSDPSSINAQKKQSQKTAIAQYKAACNAAIDPLDSHRSFCPWAHCSSCNVGDDSCAPGWEIYAKSLVTDPGEYLAGASEKEWQGKEMYKKVISSVSNFPNHK